MCLLFEHPKEQKKISNGQTISKEAFKILFQIGGIKYGPNVLLEDIYLKEREDGKRA